MKKQDFYTKIVNREAEKCVKCALCAPVCPTYQLTRHESESPRGRIAVAQALANHQLPLTALTYTHLNHCLNCRACERVCPAEVKYGELFDYIQALIKTKKSARLIKTFSVLHVRKFFYYLLYFYQRIGLRYLFQRLNFLVPPKWKRAESALPNLSFPYRWKFFYPAKKEKLGAVSLFIGCFGQSLDQASLQATLQTLTQIGYDVYISKPVCCGALALHSGQIKTYEIYQKKNIRAQNDLPIQAIISLTPACTVTLKEYSNLSFSVPIYDIHTFLLNSPWRQSIRIKPYPHTVTLHTPCTLQNVLKESDAPYQLLKRIPEIEVKQLPVSLGCCGASGSYFLTYPEMADALLEKTLKAIEDSSSQKVLTSNIGCQLHLNLGFKRNGMRQQAEHPILLFSKQLFEVN